MLTVTELAGNIRSEAEIFETSSLEIEANEIIKRTTGRIRFLCIAVLTSMSSWKTSAPRRDSAGGEGIMAVDDFFNYDLGRREFATCFVLRRRKAMVAFVITSSKLYAAAYAVGRAGRRSGADLRHLSRADSWDNRRGPSTRTF
jgi:hypothetical protein